ETLPTPCAESPCGRGVTGSGICQERQSPPPSQRPITGISRSFTTEVTTLPTAAPMMTPTARASALVLRRNATKSLSMAASLLRAAVRGRPVLLERRHDLMGQDLEAAHLLRRRQESTWIQFGRDPRQSELVTEARQSIDQSCRRPEGDLGLENLIVREIGQALGLRLSPLRRARPRAADWSAR